jgi:hypothetical protein
VNEVGGCGCGDAELGCGFLSSHDSTQAQELTFEAQADARFELGPGNVLLQATVCRTGCFAGAVV